MMKWLKSAFLMAAIAVAFTLSSCGSNIATGAVVNVNATGAAYSGADWSLVGAQVTLTDLSDTRRSYSSQVEDDGTFSFYGARAGTYRLEASLGGWTFVPRTLQLFGSKISTPDLLAYQTPSGDAADDILLMVSWENRAMDVDAYMVRDISDDDAMNGDLVAGWNTSLEQEIPDPETLVHRSREVQVADDEAVPRVETIVVTAPTGAAFERLRYYIRLWNQGSGYLTGDSESETPQPAWATVFVMQGTEHKGTYRIAVDSAEQVLGVVQMHWDGQQNWWVIGSYGNPFFINGDASGISGFKSVGDGPVAVTDMR